MEANKENIFRPTKIPLPMNPLPAIPKSIIEQKEKPSINSTKRHPLKQVNSIPGPSTRSGKIKPSNNDKYVTIRQRSEDLDWDFKVFRDQQNNDSIISISDDEDVVEQKIHYFETSNRKFERKNDRTPAVQALETNKVKNVKRSLKRPHSRELTSLSIEINWEQTKEGARKRLSFHENISEVLQPLDLITKSYMVGFNRDYVYKVFSHLLNSEKKPIAYPRIPSITRACVINWLMKVNGQSGNPAVIQTACWYMDSILGTGVVAVEKLQLVASACYWIAQKLHGPSVPAVRLVRFSRNAFTAERLRAAERIVISRLKFPPPPVVPQEFITYLSWWCDSNYPGEIEVAATFICMSGMLVDKTLCEEHPSVIAAASVWNALLLLNKKNLLIRLQNSIVYRAILKKSSTFSTTSSILRRAVRTMAKVDYEFRVPFEHYGAPPHYVSQRVVKRALEYVMINTDNERNKEVL